MKRLKTKNFEEYDGIIDERGKNVAWRYPKSILKDSEFFEYDDSYDSEFGGSMPKMFVRCDSKVFKELIKDLSEPQCSYVTYFDDLIKSLGESSKEYFPLSKIGVMVKSVHQDAYMNREEKASRVANAFGVPCVYNKLVSVDNNKLVLSVDCLKENEEFVEIQSNYERHTIYGIDTAITAIVEGLQYLIDEDKMTNEQLEVLLEDFIETYLFKVYILNDGDFTLQNLSVIFNKETGNYKWAPLFDMEYTLKGSFSSQFAQVDLSKIMMMYPKKFDAVMRKFSKLNSKNGATTLFKVAGIQGVGAYKRLGKLIDITNQITKDNDEMLR
ncbi:MAG: hypothetical protein IJW59_00540 [Clostridia bacterium]|nr:hypothetical protein [Clostridia bacterium]